jgi:hypothetical protein
MNETIAIQWALKQQVIKVISGLCDLCVPGLQFCISLFDRSQIQNPLEELFSGPPHPPIFWRSIYL